jgi:hypothetical protein
MKRYTVWIALCAFVCLSFWTVSSHAVQFTQLQPVVKAQAVTAAGAAQSNAATLTGASGMYTYLEGFDVTGSGATSAAVVEISTTGLANNLNWEVPVAAGVTAPFIAKSPGLFVRFPTPLRSSATNTNIVVTLPSFGSGNTNASLTVYGYTAP